MSVAKQKHGMNVLERDVMKIKIVISEALVQHTHTNEYERAHKHVRVYKNDHTQTEGLDVCFIDLI